MNKRADKLAEMVGGNREATKRAWADPEKRQRRIEAIKLAVNAPEARLRKSQALKRALADPEVRRRRSERMKVALADPAKRQRKSEAARLRIANNPECLKPLHEGLRRAWADPKKHKEMAEANRIRLANPDVQKRKGESVSRAWARNPTRRATQSALFKNVWAEHRSKGDARDHGPSSSRRGRRPKGDDEARRIVELYNKFDADRTAAGEPRSEVWKKIKRTRDSETGNPRSEETYKSIFKRYFKRTTARDQLKVRPLRAN